MVRALLMLLLILQCSPAAAQTLEWSPITSSPGRTEPAGADAGNRSGAGAAGERPPREVRTDPQLNRTFGCESDRDCPVGLTCFVPRPLGKGLAAYCK